MSRKRIIIPALVLSATIGFLVGRSLTGSGSSSSLASNTPTGPRAQSKHGLVTHHGEDLEASGKTGPSQTQDPGLTAASDPRTSLMVRMETIINNPDPADRAEAWLDFVKSLDPDEIEGVVAIFRSGLHWSSHHLEHSILMTAWAEHDPKTALEQTVWHSPRHHILATWAGNDPVSAIRWAQDNENTITAWMLNVIRGIAPSDPDLAMELASDMTNEHQRGQAVSVIQGYYLKRGPKAAREWALSVEDDSLRHKAIGLVAESLARTDPIATADWLVANPSEGSAHAMDLVMAKMASEDSRAALAFMDSISDPALKSRAILGITNELSAIDPETTLAMIDSELVNDDIIRQFASGACVKAPILAVNAIKRIEDKDIRIRTYRNVLLRWVESDLESAANWVKQNDFEEDLQRTLDLVIDHGRSGFHKTGLEDQLGH